MAQRELSRPLPTKTKKDREREKSARLRNVASFNQNLEHAKALGLVVSEWPQPFANTGFGGADQFIYNWDEVAHRNRLLLTLLEGAADPAKAAPVSADQVSADQVSTDLASAEPAKPEPTEGSSAQPR